MSNELIESIRKLIPVYAQELLDTLHDDELAHDTFYSCNVVIHKIEDKLTPLFPDYHVHTHAYDELQRHAEPFKEELSKLIPTPMTWYVDAFVHHYANYFTKPTQARLTARKAWLNYLATGVLDCSDCESYTE